MHDIDASLFPNLYWLFLNYSQCIISFLKIYMCKLILACSYRDVEVQWTAALISSGSDGTIALSAWMDT